MRYLAIDHGTKRIGLAICDAGQTIVSPLDVLPNRSDAVDRIVRIVRDEAVGGLVVGHPLNMDDSEGPQAAKAKAFARHLGKVLDLPVSLQDERLSSFGADEKLQTTGLSKAKQRALRDAMAAAEILQAFLDAQAEP